MSASLPSQPVVELNRVSRLYGSFAALRDVSVRVHAGAAVLLLGENGAGKSTLLRLLSGLIAPSSGTIAVFGSEPHTQRDRFAFMSHAPMLYEELTGLENLRYFAALYATGNASPADPEQALRDVGLDPKLPRHVGDYSQGMRQRASLARVLMLSPDLLLLDEPFSNLDAASVQLMIARLRSFLAQPGRDGIPRTLFVTTHQADLARPLASTVLSLHAGQLTPEAQTSSSAQSLPANPAIRK